MRTKRKKTKNLSSIFAVVIITSSLIAIGALIYSSSQKNQPSTIFGATGATSPVDQDGNWTLVFNDEFDSSSVDTSKWVNGYYYGTQDNNMGNAVMNNSSVDGEYLHLRATGSNSSFTVGALTTKQIFQTGYFEARMKLAKGTGSWPAFWALSESGNHREVDFLEYLGNSPMSYYATLHKDGSEVGQKRYSGSIDLSSDFHIYAGEITPSYIAMYFDGEEIWRTSRSDFQAPYKITVNQGIMCKGVSWDNNKCDSTTFANQKETQVDWVRIWARGSSPTSTPNSTPTPKPTVKPTTTPTPTPRPTVKPSPTPIPTRTPTPRPTIKPPSPSVTSLPTPTPVPGIDTVSIHSAYVTRFWRFTRLRVVATSSKAPDARLIVEGFGNLRYSRYSKTYSGYFYTGWRNIPNEITVKSSLGGVATSPVTSK